MLTLDVILFRPGRCPWVACSSSASRAARLHCCWQRERRSCGHLHGESGTKVLRQLHPGSHGGIRLRWSAVLARCQLAHLRRRYACWRSLALAAHWSAICARGEAWRTSSPSPADSAGRTLRARRAAAEWSPWAGEAPVRRGSTPPWTQIRAPASRAGATWMCGAAHGFCSPQSQPAVGVPVRRRLPPLLQPLPWGRACGCRVGHAAMTFAGLG